MELRVFILNETEIKIKLTQFNQDMFAQEERLSLFIALKTNFVGA